MKSISSGLVLAAFALSGCITASSPSMPLKEARDLALDFQARSFTPPQRTIAKLRHEFADLPRKFGDECATVRIKRAERLRELADNMLKGSTESNQVSAAMLVVAAEAELRNGNFKGATSAAGNAYIRLGEKGNQVRQAVLATLIGRMYATSGDYGSASSYFARATRRWNGASSGGKDWRKTTKGRLYINASDASQARMKGDLPAEEFFLRETLKLARYNSGGIWEHIDRDELSARLTSNLILQGRFAEAELTARSMVKRIANEKDYRPLSAGALSDALYAQGRFDDAAYMARATLGMHYRSCSEADGIPVVEAWSILLKALGAQGKWTDILGALETIKGDMNNRPGRYRELFADNPDIFMARAHAADDTALPRDLGKAIDRATAAGGAQSREVLELNLIRGLALYLAGRVDRAYAAFHGAMEPYLYGAYTGNGSVKAGNGKGRAEFFRQAYLALLSSDSGRAAARREGVDVAQEVFRMATIIPSGKVQGSFLASASRAAAKDPELAALVRQTQDVDEQARDTADILAYLQTAPSGQVEAVTLREMRERVVALNRAKATLEEEALRRFPAYADLMRPRSPSLGEIGQSLNDDEAMIVFYTSRDTTYVWAVPKSGAAAFAVADLGQKELAETVALLRTSLDPGSVATLADIPAFDVRAAYDLYAKLLKPVESGWKSAKSLLVVTDGPLGQLPLSLLPTEPVKLGPETAPLFSSHRDIPWLARTHAVTVLPSVASLKALRGTTVAGGERRPFVGFGDPYFSKSQELAANEAKPIQVASTEGATRGMPVKLRSKPQTRGVDSATLALLPRLPDTRTEISAIAETLGADPSSDVFLGAKANEGQVKTMDLSGYKVIAFATHGLVPGDLNGLTQPALALSSPEVTGGKEDGLLTMGEILGLRLNADWAVLSACNTASADGKGAEAVSGLGRAFFYAGARALLVSNWPVHSAATTELTTDLFRRQAADGNLSRAEALRRTRVHLIDEAGFKDDQGRMAFSYAHPIFWAPFTVVGDGGGGRPPSS